MLRDIRFLLETHYSDSHALVIGIDKYEKAPQLSYAVSDAEAVRDVLLDDLGFPPEKVTCLLDEEATRSNILRSYLAYANDGIGLDDRLLVFFAGHGHTLSGFRGDIGYLVPVDADPNDVSTLIRWSEFTESSELIRAKHVLFIMDACYGGLMLTRGTTPGSTRFLKDMLLRYSRQVLTAGKSDEIVADAGGPLLGHSVFTGHLIQGLQGAATGEAGVLTASGLMAYVYNKVATDKNSNQTPHYGHFDGDGDFILRAPQLAELDSDETKDMDRLVVMVGTDAEAVDCRDRAGLATAKRLLALPGSAIELHDYVMGEVSQFLAATTEDFFANGGSYSDAELHDRIARYEDAASDLSQVLAVVAHWAQAPNLTLVRRSLIRAVERLGPESGLQAWLVLRWYPVVFQMYSAGIAATYGERYDVLADMLLSPAGRPRRGGVEAPLALCMSDAMLEFTRSEIFKRLPGHDRHFAPMSEYLFKVLQPSLDAALFMGTEYERAFDAFEVMFALVTADLNERNGHGVWGNFGRFGWKERHAEGPLNSLIAEATTQGSQWPPLSAGLFGGDPDRFAAISGEYLQSTKKLGWG